MGRSNASRCINAIFQVLVASFQRRTHVHKEIGARPILSFSVEPWEFLDRAIAWEIPHLEHPVSSMPQVKLPLKILYIYKVYPFIGIKM